ncbi:MAG: type II toxin-antitoxin system PemK/MazF family toxin [Actinobacteria bacterium]|nr:type II toxin-antitoxin system PemK/MazF family toxin [Actinomycetota bacterium]
MTTPHRGEVWWAEVPDTGRRPFLVMTRDRAIPVLHSLLAAPVTRTVRGIATEVPLGTGNGLPQECAVSLDNLRVVPKRALTTRICSLGPDMMAAACAALIDAVDC